MADISKEIRDFEEAEYGEEVRDSMIALAEKVNADGEKSLADVAEQVLVIRGAVQVSTEAVEIATTAVARSNETLDHADDVLDGATQQAISATGSAANSKSWAIGDTGTRPGENTDNSLYYSMQSRTDSNRAKQEADRAAQYSKIIAPGFYLDVETSTLYMKTGVGVDFVLEDSRLYWKIA